MKRPRPRFPSVSRRDGHEGICLFEWARPCFVLFVTVVVLAGLLPSSGAEAAGENPPGRARIAVAGLVHDHVLGLLWHHFDRDDLEIVGVAESNRELRERIAKDYVIAADRLFAEVEDMLETTQPDGVFVFTRTAEHPDVVAACAVRGIDVMVEKPFAVDLAAARQMAQAANQSGIHLMVNYQNTWWTATQEIDHILNRDRIIGSVKKLIFFGGHPGPDAIGCSPEFQEWLYNPEASGGGVLIDFGCYGANLISWLLRGERPTSVTAVTHNLKPKGPPEIEDEATIVMKYPDKQAQLLVSWNWPKERKDIEVYGTEGYVANWNDNKVRLQTGDGRPTVKPATPLPPQSNNPYSYFAAVATGTLEPSGPSQLKYNLLATEILDAARRSANQGCTIVLTP